VCTRPVSDAVDAFHRRTRPDVLHTALPESSWVCKSNSNDKTCSADAEGTSARSDECGCRRGDWLESGHHVVGNVDIAEQRHIYRLIQMQSRLDAVGRVEESQKKGKRQPSILSLLKKKS
jgi:hypothetical protein